MLSSPKGKTSFSKEMPRSVSCITAPEKKEGGKRAHDELEKDYNTSSSSSSGSKKVSPDKQHKAPHQRDSSAALMLLQLRPRGVTADNPYEGEHREKRQRRSSVPHQIP
jgi:hypothetical protein